MGKHIYPVAAILLATLIFLTGNGLLGTVTPVRAHLEGFGGPEGVKKGKGELYDHLRDNNGTAFVLRDSEDLRQMSRGIPHVITYGTHDADYTGRVAPGEKFLNIEITHGATIGIIVIYVAAILDKGLKIGLMSRLAQQVVIVLIPPLALIFLVLGTIFLGIATPTEGGAMGAVGALVMAAAKGRLSMDVVRQALTSTTRLSSFVLFILIGARTFSLTFYGVNGHLWVEHLLLSVPGGELGFLIAGVLRFETFEDAAHGLPPADFRRPKYKDASVIVCFGQARCQRFLEFLHHSM